MSLELVTGSTRDLGGFSVRRLLPSAAHRSVGPFVFLDHLGPAVLDGHEGVQVRPHPHIGLATVTYLFEGAMVHRDSLGSVQAIVPGDVNWMTAGRGIVHSERSPAGDGQPIRMHAVQSWVALPRAHEDDAPSFAHHAAATLPRASRDGVVVTLVAGHGFGLVSPVRVLSPTLYAAVQLAAGATLVLDDEHAERAVLPVLGTIAIDGEPVAPAAMAVLSSGETRRMAATSDATVMVLGGAPLDGPRALDWNFVASDRAAIDRARDDWRGYPNGRFPQVPGETESIPLPERARPANPLS